MLSARGRSLTVIAVPLTACLGIAVAGEEFEMAWWTIDCGGLVRATGGEFELSSTFGQPDAGPGSLGMAAGAYTLTGGFWFAVPPDDCNSDGSVNLYDYDDFEPCISGPGGVPFLSSCSCFDADGDEDVDLLDVHRLMQEFTGG